MKILKLRGYLPNIKLQYCFNCKKQFTYADVCKNWLCPDCQKPISLKIETSNSELHCKNISIKQINPADKIIVTPNFVSEIIKNEEKVDCFYLAIKNCRYCYCDKSSVITKVIGIWNL